MTDDDFNDDIDNFDDEFEDFVAEDSGAPAGQPAAGGTPPSQKPGGSRMGIIAIAAVVVLVGSYFGFDWLSKSTEPETVPPAENIATAPEAGETPAAAMLPEPMAPTDAPVAPTDTAPTESIDDMAIDFAESFSQPEQPPQLTDAVPAKPQMTQQGQKAPLPKGTKTFEQVQRDLQPNKMVVPEEINATLDSISEEMTLNVKQIKQLETLITNMAVSIDQLNRTISAMDNRVLSLTETVDTLSQDLTNVKRIIIDEDLDLTAPATVKFSNKKQAAALNTTAPGFTVHAIIPGRAWLKSSSGQIITVREGDKVGDYGTVAVIDAANGLVRTSSGITFR